jgi:hypothetical protein
LDCNPNKKYSSSIAQITKNSTSSFYPNPVESEINFNFIAQKNIVEIYDMMGRKRLSEIVSDKKISIGDLAKGMYWIQINEEPPLKMMKK